MSSNIRAVRAVVFLTIAALSAITTVFVKTTIAAANFAGRKFRERKSK